VGFQLLTRMSHDKRRPGKGKHLQVIKTVANGHDLFARDPSIIGPRFERVTGTAAVQHTYNGQITSWVLGWLPDRLGSECSC
jgi:hypothetical protein